MFIHLHTHSHYSLLDGLPKIPDLVNRAKELKMTALALTDHGVMYGIIDFYKACKKAGIKPILGVEAYVAPRRHTDKESSVDTKPYHLVLLAKNEIGYKNLLKLTSIAHLDGYYYKPRVDKDLLKQYGEGIIACSACLNGEVARHLLSENYELAERALWEYKQIFGEGNFYLEVQPQTSRRNNDQEIANRRLIELARKTNTPLVATKDAHYIYKEDAEAQDALLCIQTGKTLDNPDRLTMRDIDCSFSSEEEMAAFFPDLSEALYNTVKIAEACNVELTLGTNILPKFEVPASFTIGSETPYSSAEVDYLRHLCEDGLLKRYKEITPQIRERLDWELSIINRMGFASYFLIVNDLIAFAKNRGIVVGPGRGSAAGSIISYCLGITDLDPIHYNLLFERFLNPDRISMPDIDLDFSDTRRNEVIDYATKKYGADRVAGIITFGTMMARAVLRDVGRIMGVPYADCDRIAKMIPPPVQGKHTPLSQHIEEIAELRELREKNPEIKRLMDLAVKLEGTVRHASQHACAVIIGDQPLTEYAPLQKGQGGDVDIVTQYSLHPMEDVGLLKIDFLGLANLSIIQDAIEIVEAVLKNEGREIKIDIGGIPLDDKKTFALLSRAETTGVFQLESAGMKRYIKELRPTGIEDIIAMVALYRPGPMQFIDSFIKRKHGREGISYLHPLMENATKNTYGMTIYQEQVMQISKDMAGFTGGEADTLRKAIGKKIPELMAKMRVRFIEGSVKNGVAKGLAETIFTQFEDFAAYSFNRSHAACYAMIAYRTAYLKAHWPNCFMAALMNADSGDLDRITIEVEECKSLGLTVLPPDLNESYARFAVVPGTNKIRFGLLAVKNIGSDIVEAIILARKAAGKFDCLENFLERVCHKNLNKKSLESLIKCGAMDSFGERGAMLANIQKMLDFNHDIKSVAEKSERSLFGGRVTLSKPVLKMDFVPPADAREKLAWEKELLGLYITSHPYAFWQPYLSELAAPSDRFGQMKDNEWLTAAGVITAVKQIRTKKNEPMNFVTLEDAKNSFEVLVFPSVLEKNRELWKEDTVVIVRGRMSFKDGQPKILASSGAPVSLENMEKIKAEYGKNFQFPISKFQSNSKSQISNSKNDIKTFFDGNLNVKKDGIYITVPPTIPKHQAEIIKEYLQKHPGDTQVFLQVAGSGKTIPTTYKVDRKKFV